MYRVSPFTYLVSSMLSSGVANNQVVCAGNEILHFNPPSGQTCMEYVAPYIKSAGGYLANGSGQSTSQCAFCPLDSTNTFLAQVASSYSTRWRDFGLLWVFIGFNVILAIFFYWLARVPKNFSWRKKKIE